MLRIIGLRKLEHTKTRKVVQTEAFGHMGWQAPNHESIFKSLVDVLQPIPQEERWNLYYTLHHVAEGSTRTFLKCTAIAFDIDKIPGYHEGLAYTVGEIVCRALGLVFKSTAIISSGNGVHIIAALTEEFHISNEKYFDEVREHYKACCGLINRELENAEIGGMADPAIFDRARIMRLPGTDNIKEGRPTTHCVVVQGDIVPQAWDIIKASRIPKHEAKDTLPIRAIKDFPTPDTEAVLDGCSFLKWQKESPEEVTEPEWYAALSILGRVDKDPVQAAKIAHEYSSGHPSYSPEDTDQKLEQALVHGPRTCKSINATWQKSKCSQCPHWGKVASPITIRGPDYIKTQDTGFHSVTFDKEGRPKIGKPQYEDLRRFFQKQHPYLTMKDSEAIYTWKGKTWEKMYPLEVKGFATTHFKPFVSTGVAMEFMQYLMRYEPSQRMQTWFDETTRGKLNFQNGVLDLNDMSWGEHTKENGFRKILPYAYDATATCPLFDKFLDDVTLGRDELKEPLLQFAGYSLSNDPNWEHKSMILKGEGRNGKSTFVNILKALAGEGSYSSMTLVELEKDTNRYVLDGALFNISEETPDKSLLDSALFKNLTAGGEMQVKKLYEQPYNVRNKAKLWLLCNSMPPTKDMSFAMFKRLAIVPFEATFDGINVDKHIEKKLVPELPGIFNKVLAAYRRMQEAGGLVDSALMSAELERYRKSVDTVDRWFFSFVEVLPSDSNVMAKVDEMYAFYKEQQERDGERFIVSHQVFCKKLSILVDDYKTRVQRTREGGERVRVVKGLRLLTGGAAF